MNTSKSICNDNYEVKDKFQDLKISMPAKRALEKAGIKTLEDMAKFSEKDLLKLHGFGKASLKPIYQMLKSHNLPLKK